MDGVKVFISYSHDSEEHKQRVLDLATKLIDLGINCELDQFLGGTPQEGWPRWMINQIVDATYVLIVNSEIYMKRFEGHDTKGKGLGGKWEGAIITQQIYEDEMHNMKFVPVVFGHEDVRYIPLVLRSATYYNISTELQFEDLYRYLTNQPKIAKPQLGKIKVLETGINLKSTNPNNLTINKEIDSVELKLCNSQEHCKIDANVYNRLKQFINQDDSIQFLREHDFGNSYARNSVSVFFQFENLCRTDKELKFFDNDLESLRVEMLNAVTDFTTVLAKNSFPINGLLNSIPRELIHTDPDKFQLIRGMLNESSTKITTLYDKLVTLARTKLLV